ncbi:hypothetical protein RF11_09991 [Thelohanellus kitauei]|uniref:Uncharacterized protein n=1 Tax=Thelohanellus kitauei TaxID=669202 RepID=A0A0C2IZL3_THEKT|nr:hypothetical protein RF11_09991 [Thelohanellus kitauei]
MLCQTPCSGDRELACGGLWKNLIYHSVMRGTYFRQIDEKKETNFTAWFLTYIKLDEKHKKDPNDSIKPPVRSPEDKYMTILANINSSTPEPNVETTTIVPVSKSKNLGTSYIDLNGPSKVPKLLGEGSKNTGIEVKSNILSTQKQEDMRIALEPLNVTGSNFDIIKVKSYICYMVLKQPWIEDLNNKESSTYKIIHGNFVKAVGML